MHSDVECTNETAKPQCAHIHTSTARTVVCARLPSQNTNTPITQSAHTVTYLGLLGLFRRHFFPTFRRLCISSQINSTPFLSWGRDLSSLSDFPPLPTHTHTHTHARSSCLSFLPLQLDRPCLSRSLAPPRLACKKKNPKRTLNS